MKSAILILFTCFITGTLTAQIRELQPHRVVPLDLSAEGEKKFNDNRKAMEVINDKMNKKISLTEAENQLLKEVDETIENYWDIESGGCSWYCGGGPNTVMASSALKGQGENTYHGRNAHDLNYKTAWVEGAAGYGIGEYIIYNFSPESPRVNEVIVVNGYVKTQAAWENNSRVKKLKLYYNDKPYAVLNLKDQRAAQYFKVEPFGHGDREDGAKLKSKPAWRLKFEIMEVYKGAKYDDVALTEIYFDGLDVHCFAKGTLISTTEGLSKKIEDLVVGDPIVTLTDGQLKTSRIEKLEKVIHHTLVKYQLQNGIEITATEDHPFYVANKGWASLNPEGSRHYKGFKNISKIEPGDEFSVIDANGKLNSVKLRSIEILNGHYETYTISKLSAGDNFIANGLVVGVEELDTIN